MSNTQINAAEWSTVDLNTGELLYCSYETFAVRRAENSRLVEEILKLEQVLPIMAVTADKLRLELKRRMEQDGATEYVGSLGKAVLKESRATYDPAMLDTLLEYLQPEELVETGALVPEHEETRTVGRKWNATKLKPFAKRGRVIRDAIDAARVTGSPYLEVHGPDE